MSERKESSGRRDSDSANDFLPGLLHFKQLNEVFDSVDGILVQWPIVGQLASHVGCRPSYLIPLVISAIMLVCGVFDDIITNAVGFFYPAWQSIKAIESHEVEDDKQWLTYWVVFAAFSVVELFSDILLFWIPFYYIIKISFLLWLFLPDFKGATFIYNRVIRPAFLQNEKRIEGSFNQVINKVAVGEQLLRDANSLRRRAVSAANAATGNPNDRAD